MPNLHALEHIVGSEKFTPMPDAECFTDSHVDFKGTKAYFLIKDFLFRIDSSIKAGEQTEICPDHVIFSIREIVDNTPLSQVQGRYANPGMVDVIEKIESITTSPYLKNSFGNKVRMDFGTGHELNFLCYLFVQCQDNCIDITQTRSILAIYFQIVRTYIRKFNIEAAGSRGCWSVDDYLLLPYLFGSSENFSSQEPIEKIQGGIFKDAQSCSTSMMLKNICKLPWPNINMGMFKMYDEEVLSRRVVTQHFIYTKYLPSSPHKQCLSRG